MLAHRVIPTLLAKGPGLVKGRGFDAWRRVGPVMPAIRVYGSRDIDEIVFLDIEATPEGRGPDTETVADLVEPLSVPKTVGGGVRSMADFAALLEAGADKVAINTIAVERPDLIREASQSFGAQCVVVSIDVRGGEVVTRCGTRATGLRADEWAERVAGLGAGEILLCDVTRDGTMEGYNLDLIRSVRGRVNLPIVATGGCGSYQHMHEAILAGADAVAAASIFHFTEMTPRGASEFLASRGLPIRL